MIVAGMAAQLSHSQTAKAADQYFDTNGSTPGIGGTSNWITTANWSTAAAGNVTTAAWVNGNNDNAIFGGTAGTVTLNGSPNVRSMLFNVTGYTISGAGTLTLTSSGLAGSTGLLDNAATINVLNSGQTAIISSIIGGSAGLTKDGLGQLTLQGASTYTGATVINNGSVLLDFNTSGGTTIINGASALTLAGGSLTITPKKGASNVEAFTGLTVGAGSSSILFNTNNGGTTGSLDLGNTTRNVAGGTIDFTAGFAIKTKTLNSNGILGGWATYADDNWAVSAGTGSVSGAITALGTYGTSYSTATSATNFDVTTSATFTPTSVNSIRFNNGTARTATLNGVFTIGSGGILVTTGTGSVLSQITGGTSLTSGNGLDLIVIQNNASGNLTIASKITGSIGFTKSGVGLVTLSNTNNDFTGDTTINGGTINIAGDGALGNSTADIRFTADGKLQAGAATINLAAGRDITIKSQAIATIDTLANTMTVAGVISGPDTTGLTKAGSGTLLLTNTNDYGVTTISAGTLKIGGGSTTGTLGNGAVTNNATLSFNRSDAITISNVISGTGVVNHIGGGFTTFSSVNSYSGGTNVSAGTLIVGNNTALGTTGTIAVTSGGTLAIGSGFTLGRAASFVSGSTLAGKGTYSTGGTFASGVTITPGIADGTNNIGTLTLGAATTLSSGAVYSVDLDMTSGAGDQLIVNGAITVTNGANLVLRLVNATPGTSQTPKTFKIIDGTSATFGTSSPTGGFTISPGNAIPFTYTESFSNATGDYSITITSVPEPTSCGVFLSAGIGCLLTRRRRNAQR